MRIDKFLKNSRVIKRRTVAKMACDSGRVSVNGHVAKAGAEVVPGDVVTVAFGDSTLKFRVLATPEAVRKDDAQMMYELLEG